MAAIHPVVVAIDGSEESKQALRTACRIAKGLDLPVQLVTVLPPPQIYPGGIAPMLIETPDATGACRDVLREGEDLARDEGVTKVRSELLEGTIVESILEFLRAGTPFMAVLGARGLSMTARVLLGSVSDGVVHHAPCPVLIVRSQPPPSKKK